MNQDMKDQKVFSVQSPSPNPNRDDDIKTKQPGKGCLVCIIVSLVLGIALVVIGGVSYPVVDKIIKEQVKRTVIISESSEVYDIWQDVPVPVYMQFFLFNIANPDEVKDGGKPFLEQKGPYTYRERRVKFDIVWNSNGTVSYKQNRTFAFLPEMSNGSEHDQVTTINPLTATLAHNYDDLPSWERVLLRVILPFETTEDIIITRPVHELIWGYEDQLLNQLHLVRPNDFPTTKIGYFIRKNHTDDGHYTVMTGETDIDQLGVISRYNGADHLKIWTSEYANMVNGSDGTLGPPFRFDSKFSPIFVSDICRSIRGIYSGDVETPNGIKLRRFAGDRKDMENATSNPDNKGFCTPADFCLPSGLLNSIRCQEPVDGLPLPVVFSFPHFLYADPTVQESVSNLHPIEEEHRTTVDAEPWTGLVLQVAKRLQINMFVKSKSQLRNTHKIRDMIFPILWLNESSVVDDERADMLKDKLFTPMEVARYGKIGILVLGGLFVLVAVGMFVRRRVVLSKMRKSSLYTMDDRNGYLSYDNHGRAIGAGDGLRN